MLPRHAITETLVCTLRGLGVDTEKILWRKQGRLGLYFVEVGANQRGSTVLYDREYSAISMATPEEYDFAAAWPRPSGCILLASPAISENACRANLALVQQAKKAGVTVSCDLNFRKKLWNWRPGTASKQLARECMTALLPFVDLVIANGDAADVLNIHASGTDVTQGHVDAAAYEQVAREIVRQFPNVSRVAITLRESLSADHNNWGAMLLDTATNQVCFAPTDASGDYQPYEIRDIVDRVGGGDSFAAGLIYGLNAAELGTPEKALQFAVAASCHKTFRAGRF